MRRHRRGYLSGLFFNTGNYDVRSEENNFGFTRQFSEAINQEMMDDERMELEHKKKAELNQEKQGDQVNENPSPSQPAA
ncbi:hypothetical protein H9Q13_12585 [Pontibacter sp. JH31]|uniref:Uncharacterized protein n=1 Tax=Pontibacter aquaedesilientis TaxID=2766980 RepID=A0ABR7XKS5_9BACT|nr:hypothetical protein [Pontibacter aquaedesilientis]MBD1398006.1 hypothetical protein [Pontibacter aquaedesilientis]